MRTSSKEQLNMFVLVVWASMMIIAVALSIIGGDEDISPHYDKMLKASQTAQQAMDAIKQYKVEKGMPIYEYDKLETGLIGSEDYTAISTTDGILPAKRTTCNANWAAVIVSMFIKAGLTEGDEVGMVFSGSFPAMNICAMAAAQEYGVKPCIMASVGASLYGANDPDLTFFDMANYLSDLGILTHRIDYVSFGGSGDVGNSFPDPAVKNDIKQRILDGGATFIYEDDFEKNIALRIDLLHKKVPHMGFLLNVGGSSVGVGTGLNSYIKTGYRSPNAINVGELKQKTPQDGLLHVALQSGIPIASMLNIKGLAEDYGIPYDPSTIAKIGQVSGCKAYYSISYDIVIPIIALCISICILVFYFIINSRFNAERTQPNERNYILCRR